MGKLPFFVFCLFDSLGANFLPAGFVVTFLIHFRMFGELEMKDFYVYG